jgi:predicted metalloprotease with PDZ domain
MPVTLSSSACRNLVSGFEKTQIIPVFSLRIVFFSYMKRFFFLFWAIFLLNDVFAQKLSYQVSFPNIAHHEGFFELTVTGARQNNLTFRMSRSSPGRYATHEYGKNVYDVKAFDRTGAPVAVRRVDGDVYEVANKSGFVKVQYILYANHPDGTYAGIDPGGVHLNIPASFMWVKGLENAPVDVKFLLPSEKKNWTIATQLFPTTDANTFTAPDLQYLMDSPVKIGALKMQSWKVDQAPYNFVLALEAEGNDSLAKMFMNKVKKITEESKEVFGEFPVFENNQYTFLTSINPYVKGDGMEHRNSTVIHLPTAFNGASNLLGVFSHEFFHAWNVERIRPKSLEPFNYEKSNMSPDLWFAEGFTQYYGDLIMERAGFVSEEEFCRTLTSLVNTKENSAGAKRLSPADASCMAVFVDAGVAVDKTNYPNTFTSYYPYGASIALALDLELRVRNRTLDNFMQALWKKHGKTEIPYVIADLEAVLEQVSGDQVFAKSFFDKYVYGRESFDYGTLLQKAGMTLKKQFEGRAWIGDVRWADGKAVIASNTIMGSPLYAAGLDIDDHILSLDGKSVVSQGTIMDILASHKPSDQLSLEYKHRNEIKMTMITLAENPRFVVDLNERLNLPMTAEMLKFRKQWLGSKVLESR